MVNHSRVFEHIVKEEIADFLHRLFDCDLTVTMLNVTSLVNRFQLGDNWYDSFLAEYTCDMFYDAHGDNSKLKLSVFKRELAKTSFKKIVKEYKFSNNSLEKITKITVPEIYLKESHPGDPVKIVMKVNVSYQCLFD